VSAIQLRVLGLGVLFVSVFVSGFGLSRSGNPYPSIKFNMHKLLGLAAGIFWGSIVFQAHQISPILPRVVFAGAVTGVLFVCTVIAGGLLSITRPMPSWVKVMHKLFPYLILFSAGVTLYLIF
jgi:hypothetical protein